MCKTGRAESSSTVRFHSPHEHKTGRTCGAGEILKHAAPSPHPKAFPKALNYLPSPGAGFNRIAFKLMGCHPSATGLMEIVMRPGALISRVPNFIERNLP